MQSTQNSPTAIRSESIAASPAPDSQNGPGALTETHSAFDPADWLAAFERVGGGWVLRDDLALAIYPEGRTESELNCARRLVVSLTQEQRKAILAHLREGEA
jgi:hypothetical protein